MCDPLGNTLDARLDCIDVPVAHVLNAVADPINMILDCQRHVIEHRRTLRAGNCEEVRKTVHHQAQLSTWAIFPALCEAPAGPASHAHSQQRPGHCVEPGGEHDTVEFVP